VLKLRELIEFLQQLEQLTPGLDFQFEILGGRDALSCTGLPEAQLIPDREGGNWFNLELKADTEPL
jgi:hypothetical protein